MNTNTNAQSPKSWQSIISKYNKPKMSHSVGQLINSLVPYFLLWIIIVQVIKISPWLAIPFIILAAGFLVRIFIIFHDCGHGSFFSSKKLNFYVGSFCGMLAFTPYHKWTDSHRLHHQTVGNLDKRGFGDVWTLTVDEYQEKTPWKKFLYRFFRHPMFLIVFGGPLSFTILSRVTHRRMNKKQKLNIYFTNIVIFTVIALVSWWIGWQTFLFIQLPIIWLAAMGGIYLFYLQHQYDDVDWVRSEEWDYKDMALNGSSFFKLPVILRWFTGNIGYHHVHHLGPTIPNYNLVKCYKENSMFHDVKPITFFQSFHCLKLRLWDEKLQRIVSFRELKQRIV